LEIKVLKQLFRIGALNAVSVAPAPLEPGRWVLGVETKHGLHERITIANTKTEKKFKGVSAALEDARRIGFRQVTVALPNHDMRIRK
jgi:hypothetical protein